MRRPFLQISSNIILPVTQRGLQNGASLVKYTWVTYVIPGRLITLIKRHDNSGFNPLTQKTKMKTLKIISDRELAFGSLRDNELYKDVNIKTV